MSNIASMLGDDRIDQVEEVQEVDLYDDPLEGVPLPQALFEEAKNVSQLSPCCSLSWWSFALGTGLRGGTGARDCLPRSPTALPPMILTPTSPP